REAGSPAEPRDHPSYSLPPPHLIHSHRLLEPLGDELAAVREQEPFAAAQSPHCVRNQDLPTLRLRRYPRRQDHRRAEEVAVLLNWLTGIQADSDGERLAFTLSEGPLEGNCALDGFGHATERSHETVAHRLHLGAAVLLEHVAGDALVLAEDGAAADVAQSRHHLGVADEVGEEDGGYPFIRFINDDGRAPPNAWVTKKSVDCLQARAGLTKEVVTNVPFQRHELRARDLGSDSLSSSERKPP